MIAERSRGLFRMHTGVQAVLAVGAFWVWLAVFNWLYDPPAFEVSRYGVYCAIAASALVGRAALLGRHRAGVLRQGVGRRLRYAADQTLWMAVVLAFFVVAAKDKSISRVFLFSWLPVLYVTLAAANAALPAWLARRFFQGARIERTLIYALHADLGYLGHWLRRQETLGIQVIGCLSDDPRSDAVVGIPVLGGTDDLERVLTESRATQLLVPELPLFSNVLRFLAEVCEARGVRLLVYSDLERKFGQRVAMVEEDGLEFITLRGEPLESPFNRAAKRMLDIAIALPVVLGVLPLSAVVIWLVQRFQSPGPVFYRQPRAGMQNQTFHILKFRTMHTDNAAVGRQATANDDRVYPLGRHLRRFSIDELPQFINVLRGEMSVVGPRPHLAEHNEQWARALRNYHVRSFVKPGITGLAQVRGFRGEATTEEAIRLRALSDIDYIENWSFMMDLLIILRTGWHVVAPPRTAY